MNDETMFGLLWGAIIMLVIALFHWAPYHNKLGQCESTLPRNQYCVLIAVPESEVKE